jgi:ABC-type transporter Mla subunit MlaD
MRKFQKKLERHPFATGVGVLVMIMAVTVFGSISLNAVPGMPKHEYKAVLDPEGIPLKKGDEVRTAGQRTGTVLDVTPAGDNRVAKFFLTGSQGPIGRDARVTLRQKGPAGRVYVQVDRGDWRRQPAPDGWTVPRSRTFVYRDLPTILQDFDAKSRKAAALATQRSGEGLMGRGDDLNQVIADLYPLAHDATPVLRSTRPDRFDDMLHWSGALSRGFGEPGRNDLERLQPVSRSTLETMADRRDAIAATFERMRPFEDEVRTTLAIADPLIDDSTALSRELTPGLRALRDATPDTNALLARGRTIKRAVLRLEPVTNPVLRTMVPLMGELEPGLKALEPIPPRIGAISAQLAPFGPEIKAFQTTQDDVSDGGFSKVSPMGLAPGAHTFRVMLVTSCTAGYRAHRPPGLPFGTDRTEVCTGMEESETSSKRKRRRR